MKKILLFATTLCISLLLFSSVNAAENVDETDYTYTVSENEATITGFAEYITEDIITTGKVILPDKIGGYPVTTIGENAFAHYEFITSVEIPNSVTSIGDNAFFGCENLKIIDIPKTVTDLGYQTFAYCSSLESMEIPDGVTQLRGHVFRECTSLTYVKIPQSVTEMGKDNFSECDNLLTAGPVNGGYNIEFSWNEEIPANSFYSAEITKIVIPEGITRILENAFAFCTNLCDITLPSTIESTELSGLDQCQKITTAGPVGGDYDLKISCTNLTYNIIGIFEYLTEIVVPNTTTTIGTQAFYEMSGLRKVTLNKNVTSIADDAIDNINPSYDHTNNEVWLYVYEHSYAHKYAATHKKKCFIIDKNEEFEAFPYLSVSINDENQAIITDCYDIYAGSLTLPEVIYGFPLVEIADKAFNVCDITAITIPSSVKSIGKEAFYHSRLKEITIPNSVTYIGNSAFESCRSLERISIPYSVTTLEPAIFRNCQSLKEVNLPMGLKTIGSLAFRYCCALENIYLPETITEIYGSAFSNCTSLVYVKLPENITNIAGSAFEYCSSLKAIIIPKSVTSIGVGSFSSVNTDLVFCVYAGTYGETYAVSRKKKIELIKETENLYYYSNGDMAVIIGAKTNNQTVLDIANEFKGVDCSQIKIEYGAFGDCDKLKNITIPANVSTIEGKAFYGCSALTNVYFLGSKTIWNAIDIGSDNTNLINSVLQCSIPIETSISNNGTTFTISLKNIEKDSLVILVIYYNDRFVNLFLTTYQGEDVVFNNVKEIYDTAKVMIWDGVSTMRPLCQSDVIFCN